MTLTLYDLCVFLSYLVLSFTSVNHTSPSMLALRTEQIAFVQLRASPRVPHSIYQLSNQYGEKKKGHIQEVPHSVYQLSNQYEEKKSYPRISYIFILKVFFSILLHQESQNCFCMHLSPSAIVYVHLNLFTRSFFCAFLSYLKPYLSSLFFPPLFFFPTSFYFSRSTLSGCAYICAQVTVVCQVRKDGEEIRGTGDIFPLFAQKTQMRKESLLEMLLVAKVSANGSSKHLPTVQPIVQNELPS